MDTSLDKSLQEVIANMGWHSAPFEVDSAVIKVRCRKELDDQTTELRIERHRPGGKAWHTGSWFLLSYRSKTLQETDVLLLQKVADCLDQVPDDVGERWLEMSRPEETVAETSAPTPVFLQGGDQLEIRLTLACNEECLFCNSSQGAQNLFPSKMGAEQALIQGKEAGATRLVLSGGEPLLVAWVPDLLRKAQELNYRIVTLQTNAVLLNNDPVLQSILPWKPELFISMHGTSKETVGAITRRPELFEPKLAGIEKSLASGLRCGFNFVLCKLNRHEFTPFIDWVAARPRDNLFVCLSFIAPIGSAWTHREELIPRMSNVVGEVMTGLDRAVEHGIELVVGENCGIPTCVEPRLREFAEPFDGDRPVSVPPDKTKIPACKKCHWNPRCSGIFKRYIEMYSDEEFGDSGVDPIRS